MFTVASLASALATSAAVFFAARAGQGLGAALLSPAALSIITTTFQGPDRAKALGVWGAVGGAGAAIGVLLGGTLTELVDWQAIFLINLPIGIGVAAGRQARARRRRSPSGAALTSAARWSRPRAWARSSTPSHRPLTPAGPRADARPRPRRPGRPDPRSPHWN